MDQMKPSGNRPLTPEELERILALEAAVPATTSSPARFSSAASASSAFSNSLARSNPELAPVASDLTPAKPMPDMPIPDKPISAIPMAEPPNLAQAIRRARLDAAEHAQGFNDLRSAELARLELLQDSLKPIFEQLPHGVDLFDTGITPGETPRLFIDMIAFVQMARDKRTYEFKQDRRDGRITLAQSSDLAQMTKSITDYIARRLVQRDKALETGSDEPGRWPKRPQPNAGLDPQLQKASVDSPANTLSSGSSTRPPLSSAVSNSVKPLQAAAPAPFNTLTAPVSVQTAESITVPARRHRHGWFVRSLLFIIEFLGVSALLALLIAAGFWLYLRLNGLG